MAFLGNINQLRYSPSHFHAVKYSSGLRFIFVYRHDFFMTKFVSFMSKFIQVTTGNYLIVHGFDANNKEIIEEVIVTEKMVKIVAIKRIQSISAKYILVTGSHGRMMYWEYEESFEDLQKQLSYNSLLIE